MNIIEHAKRKRKHRNWPKCEKKENIIKNIWCFLVDKVQFSLGSYYPSIHDAFP